MVSYKTTTTVSVDEVLPRVTPEALIGMIGKLPGNARVTNINFVPTQTVVDESATEVRARYSIHVYVDATV